MESTNKYMAVAKQPHNITKLPYLCMHRGVRGGAVAQLGIVI